MRKPARKAVEAALDKVEAALDKMVSEGKLCVTINMLGEKVWFKPQAAPDSPESRFHDATRSVTTNEDR